MNKKEHYEQSAFFAWVDLNINHAPSKDVMEALKLCYAVTNGANLPKKKQAYKGVDGKIKWRTWSSEAAWLKEEGGLRKGFPDINLDYSTYSHAGLRIEMKHGKNVLSPEQREKKDLLERACYKYAVCYSAMEAVRTVYGYLPFKIEDYQGLKEFLI